MNHKFQTSSAYMNRILSMIRSILKLSHNVFDRKHIYYFLICLKLVIILYLEPHTKIWADFKLIFVGLIWLQHMLENIFLWKTTKICLSNHFLLYNLHGKKIKARIFCAILLGFFNWWIQLELPVFNLIYNLKRGI